MPELPEVETTRRGIEPYISGKRVARLVVRNPKLRQPVPPELSKHLVSHGVGMVTRRGKYLLLEIGAGHLMIHLGMSGSLRIVESGSEPKKHDHIDLIMKDGTTLRYCDPRRFGLWLWIESNPAKHKLLASLGPEPLQEGFGGDYLYRQSRGRKAPVKTFIMDSHTVVGVGNIYASESLFMAGIHPSRAAGKVSLKRYQKLADDIKSVLSQSIKQGGTTLRDFVNESGNPGYFKQSLRVYGRNDKPCRVCGNPVKQKVIGQRSSFYCSECQR